MIKLISELGPLLAFFYGYKMGGMQSATLYMLVVAVATLLLSKITRQKITTISLVSTGILITTSAITIISGNSMFIKIKPTILYLMFGIVCFVSAYKNKPFLKYLLSNTFELKNYGWIVLSYRFATFFFIMAIANEIIWRNFEENIWVNFKVFVTLPITLIFIALQIPYILKNKLPTSN